MPRALTQAPPRTPASDARLRAMVRAMMVAVKADQEGYYELTEAYRKLTAEERARMEPIYAGVVLAG